MQKYQTEVLVIGGGATGTGVLRDLAMRGFQAILVERGDLTVGTTGRYHGLLHSGGRYVVKDPQAAHECIEENRILRKIMPHCIEDTGGFFVVTPWDDPDYVPRFVQGCQNAGIPVENVPIPQMLRAEPLLNPGITHCLRVPDASADSFLAADCNADSARQHGAMLLPYHRVTGLITAQGTSGLRVQGAVCQDLEKGEDVTIYADMVVNASGAWAGKIASTAGIKVHIVGGKGTMLAMNHRIVNTVINRCKMPSDGDILVPAHTVAVIGTTDVQIEDPDQFGIENWEVRLCLEEGDKLVPGFKEMRMLRAWAGVRPLYQETAVSDTRDVTRAFVLLDHEARDGVGGLITITSGKWTTYRKMAEVTTDLVCKKLGTSRDCHTHLEPLPAHKNQVHHHLGERLHTIEENQTYGDLVCECELATRADIERSILENNARTIDDVRRDARLGMGPCQGGFCTVRVAGILYELAAKVGSGITINELQINPVLRDFLQERWKGLLPILWGQQLRQERLDELIYLNILNVDHLPGPGVSPLQTVMYLPAADGQPSKEKAVGVLPGRSPSVMEQTTPAAPHLDVLVIGGGFSGLSAAIAAAKSKKKTRLITKGWGTTHWGSGCIDVLGYYPFDDKTPLASPLQGLEKLVVENPAHPYAIAGIRTIDAALKEFQEICQQANYPLHGSLEKNWLLPSMLGVPRPTCLAPETMTAGDLSTGEPMLLVGFARHMDFYPHLAASNLTNQGYPAEALVINPTELSTQKFITSRVLAARFEDPSFRQSVSNLVKTWPGKAGRIGFPAVLGLSNSLKILADLQDKIGLPVFEIPVLPPSVPGLRLHQILLAALQTAGVDVFEGMQVIEAGVEQDCVRHVLSESSARNKAHRARNFILCTGGILGGGFQTNFEGAITEQVFNLPTGFSSDRATWFQRRFLSPQPHPIYTTGIHVNPKMQPLDMDDRPVYTNLYAAGSGLAGSDYLREHSLEGVAIVTGYLAGSQPD